MAAGNQNLSKLVPSPHAPNFANVITRSTDQKDQEIVLPVLNTSTTSSPTNIITYPDNHNDQRYFDSFPPGYRFCPYDSELILYYLKKKILEESLPRNQIRDVNLYQYNPDEISGMYPSVGGNQWYFFTPRDKKYVNGSRPNRAAGTGYWKATGADKDIEFKGDKIGVKKALVFYKGKPPKGEKTDWIMQEYRVDNESSPRIKSKSSTNNMRLDDYVLCKIYKNSDRSFRGRQRNEGANQPVQENELGRNGGLFDPPAVPDGYALSRQPYPPVDPALHLPPSQQHISVHIQPPSSQSVDPALHLPPPQQHISVHIQPPPSQSIVPYRSRTIPDITNLNGNFPAQCLSQSVNVGLSGHHPLVNIHSVLDSNPNPGGNICDLDMGVQTDMTELDYADHYLNWDNCSPPSLESPEDSSIKKRQKI